MHEVRVQSSVTFLVVQGYLLIWRPGDSDSRANYLEGVVNEDLQRKRH